MNVRYRKNDKQEKILPWLITEDRKITRNGVILHLELKNLKCFMRDIKWPSTAFSKRVKVTEEEETKT